MLKLAPLTLIALLAALAGCSSPTPDEEAFLDHRERLARHARGTYECARYLGEIAEQSHGERARRIVMEFAQDRRVVIRHFALQRLATHWPDHADTEPAVRAAALDPHGPLSLREVLINACRPHGHPWLAEAEALHQRQWSLLHG